MKPKASNFSRASWSLTGELFGVSAHVLRQKVMGKTPYDTLLFVTFNTKSHSDQCSDES